MKWCKQFQFKKKFLNLDFLKNVGNGDKMVLEKLLNFKYF